jgi:hypothetical protein
MQMRFFSKRVLAVETVRDANSARDGGDSDATARAGQRWRGGESSGYDQMC